MLSEAARGVYVITPTPFTAEGALDLVGTDQMIERFLAAGAEGFTILGVMGEAPKLDAAEALAFTHRVLQRVAARVPVIVGVSAPGFAAMRALAQPAMAAGAAGVMIAPPPGLRGDDAIAAYMAEASAAVAPAPYVLQDYPQATGIFLSVGLIRRLAEDPRLVMLKAEDWPGLDKITALRALEAAGARRLSMLGGNGGQFLVEELARGTDGTMTGYAAPELLVRVCRLMAAGDEAAARDLFDLHASLIRYELQPGLGLVVRKHLLARRGFIPCAAVRAPAPRLSRETQAEVDLLWDRLVARDPGLRA